MSCVCILTPVVIAAWPAFSAAVVAAATSLGYQVASEVSAVKNAASVAPTNSNKVELEVENSEVVTNQLGREQRIAVTRDGVTITFSRDARGIEPVRRSAIRVSKVDGRNSFARFQRGRGRDQRGSFDSIESPALGELIMPQQIGRA